MLPEYENIIQILASLAAGSILGIERGFHGKPAGFKTMILICVSSCLFTILSVNLISGDRIASNIVTGIGFIGAGVVFKEGGNVRGITSAAIIWMASAIGMCIGYQHYSLALFVLLVVLLVMIVLFKFEKIFDTFHHSKLYVVHFLSTDYSIEDLEIVTQKIISIRNIVRNADRYELNKFFAYILDNITEGYESSAANKLTDTYYTGDNVIKNLDRLKIIFSKI